MAVGTFPSKFPVVVVSTREMSSHPTSFVPQLVVRLAQLPSDWGIFGQDINSCFGESPLVQGHHKQ